VITEYRVLGSLGIGAGLLLLAAANICAALHAPAPLTISVSTLSVAVLTFGCCNYSRGKGYSPLLGLTGLVPPVGLVLVSVLPDRRKQESTEVMRQVQDASKRRTPPPNRER
jgi:hypothetical protein